MVGSASPVSFVNCPGLRLIATNVRLTVRFTEIFICFVA